MKYILKVRRAIIVAIFALTACSFYIVNAASPHELATEGITISPPLSELTLNPGEVSEHKIQITNPTKNLVELYPSAKNFRSEGEGGEPLFYSADEESSSFSLAHWITFSQSKIAILPNQAVEFKFQINVPADAEPGGHYGVVFFATEPPAPSGEASQIAFSSMVGSLILVRVPGDIVEEGKLEEFSARWFYFLPPIPFTTYIRNSGNVHFRPQGEITVKDWSGKEMSRIALNPTNGHVLPKSHRRFDTKWEAVTTPFWKIPLGRFSADIRVVYGESEKTLDGRLYFWIIPWWFIITVAVIVAVLITIIIIIRRRRKNKKDKKEEGPPSSPTSLFSISSNVPGKNSQQKSQPLTNPENSPPREKST